MWRSALDAALELWTEARGRRATPCASSTSAAGSRRSTASRCPRTEDYAAEVMRMVRERFGAEVEVMAEPGRGLVAEAGVIVAEVVLVARKDEDDLVRWVYLDIGKFSGLAETIDEAIRYQFETRHGDGRDRPLHPGRAVLRLARTCSTRSGRCSCRSRSRRRQGAHPLHRRLYDELRLGRLQRLPAARRGVPGLTPRRGARGYRWGLPGRLSGSPAVIIAQITDPHLSTPPAADLRRLRAGPRLRRVLAAGGRARPAAGLRAG